MLFQRLIFYFRRPFSEASRKSRMDLFVALMSPRSSDKIIDLGGQPSIWDAVQRPLDIAMLNLGSIDKKTTHHKIAYFLGDACDAKQFASESFHIVFSNSVIEHVGPWEKQAAFAHEARRLAKRYWIQTPCKWFPIEPHCGMPFWWFYPERLRKFFISRWQSSVPDWTQMVRETTVLTKRDLQTLFPDAAIITEWRFFIPKSYIAYKS